MGVNSIVTPPASALPVLTLQRNGDSSRTTKPELGQSCGQFRLPNPHARSALDHSRRFHHGSRPPTGPDRIHGSSERAKHRNPGRTASCPSSPEPGCLGGDGRTRAEASPRHRTGAAPPRIRRPPAPRCPDSCCSTRRGQDEAIGETQSRADRPENLLADAPTYLAVGLSDYGIPVASQPRDRIGQDRELAEHGDRTIPQHRPIEPLPGLGRRCANRSKHCLNATIR